MTLSGMVATLSGGGGVGGLAESADEKPTAVDPHTEALTPGHQNESAISKRTMTPGYPLHMLGNLPKAAFL